MTVPAADNLRRHHDSHDMVCYGKACNVCREERERITAADLLDAIAALHQEYTPSGRCETCDHGWPCPTARLLQGEGE